MDSAPYPDNRQFYEKFQPEKCKEVDLINYLLDCYDRVHYEERASPKVELYPKACLTQLFSRK